MCTRTPKPVITPHHSTNPFCNSFLHACHSEDTCLKHNKQLHTIHAEVVCLEEQIRYQTHFEVSGTPAGKRSLWAGCWHTIFLRITELDVTVGEREGVWGWKPLSWAHSRHQKASKRGKKKAAHRQLDEKLLAPLQLRNEFSVIWRRIVMEMKRNLDLPVNLLSHAEMGR